jgi:hypothetical protein
MISRWIVPEELEAQTDLKLIDKKRKEEMKSLDEKKKLN